jgi:arylsulfatase A-like enzyme
MIPQHDIFKGGHIVDLAPTILTMQGVDPPTHMDGRVLNQLVEGSRTNAEPPPQEGTKQEYE